MPEKANPKSSAPSLAQYLRPIYRQILINYSPLMLLLVGLVIWKADFIYSYLTGPKKISSAELIAIKDHKRAWAYFVTITPTRFYETPLEYTRSRTFSTPLQSNRTVAWIRLAELDGRLLLIQHLLGKAKQPRRTKVKAFSGTLHKIPYSLLLRVTKLYPDQRKKLLPFMLRTDKVYTKTNHIYMGLGGILVLLVLSSILRFLYLRSSIFRFASIKGLQRLGVPEQIVLKIDEELTDDTSLYIQLKSSSGQFIHITKEWLVTGSKEHLRIWKLSELTLAHQKRIRKVFPTSHIETKIFFSPRTGRSFEIRCNHQDARKILTKLSQNAPELIVGFEKETRELWQKEFPQELEEIEARQQGSSELS